MTAAEKTALIIDASISETMRKWNGETWIGFQKLNCNCNDCLFMQRDLKETNLWRGWHEHFDYMEYLKARHQLAYQLSMMDIAAKEEGRPLPRKTVIHLEKKYRKFPFQFNSKGLINYAVCTSEKGKHNQKVTFLSNHFQLDTQHCFVHRKGVVL